MGFVFYLEVFGVGLRRRFFRRGVFVEGGGVGGIILNVSYFVRVNFGVGIGCGYFIFFVINFGFKVEESLIYFK